MAGRTNAARGTPGSFADGYSEIFQDSVLELRLAGRRGVNLVRGHHERGQCPIIATPDLMIAQVCEPSAVIAADFGSGRFTERIGDRFAIVPPYRSGSVVLDVGYNVQFTAVPLSALRALAGVEEGIPRDGDFGHLHTRLNASADLASVIDRMWVESLAGGVSGALLADAAVLQIAALMLRLRDAAQQTATRGGLAPRALRRACEMMSEDLSGQLGLADLPAEVGLSPAHFSRAFKQSTGLPPFTWLLHRRIDVARTLLRDPTLSLAQIALAVGFAGQSQFTTAFRRVVGATPGVWRRDRSA